MVDYHLHNGTDAPRLDAKRALLKAPQPTGTPVTTGTAGGAYTANEQAMINNLKTTVTELVTKLTNLGLIR